VDDCKREEDGCCWARLERRESREERVGERSMRDDCWVGGWKRWLFGAEEDDTGERRVDLGEGR
jgi:hypothetical protein